MHLLTNSFWSACAATLKTAFPSKHFDLTVLRMGPFLHGVLLEHYGSGTTIMPINVMCNIDVIAHNRKHPLGIMEFCCLHAGTKHI